MAGKTKLEALKKKTRRTKKKGEEVTSGDTEKADVVETPKVEDVMNEMEMISISLTELEMAHLQLHETRANMQIIQREKFRLEEDALNVKYRNDVAVLRGHQLNCTKSMEEAKNDYNDTMSKAETRLQVKLSDYIIQDDGTLKEAPQDDLQEPPKG